MAVVICFSMVACGGDENNISYFVRSTRIYYGDSDEYIEYNASSGEFALDYNPDKNTIVFTNNGKQYKGSLTKSSTDEMSTTYEVKWSKTPELMDDFVVDTDTTYKTNLFIIDNEMEHPGLIIPAGFDYEGRFIGVDICFFLLAKP